MSKYYIVNDYVHIENEVIEISDVAPAVFLGKISFDDAVSILWDYFNDKHTICTIHEETLIQLDRKLGLRGLYK